MFTPTTFGALLEIVLISLISVRYLAMSGRYAGQGRQGLWIAAVITQWVGAGWHGLWHLLTDNGISISESLHFAGMPFFIAGVVLIVYCLLTRK